MIRLLARCKPKPKPKPERILRDYELQDLYDEIFLEPVSPEFLLDRLHSVPKADRERSEWVMCARTWNRIRRMQFAELVSAGGLFVSPTRILEAFREGSETLYGRPVVIDEMAIHLDLRVAS